jgi:Zn-dependent protease
MGNFTALGIRLAIYMVASLFVGLAVREYVRARTAASLGDPTPRLWGRVTLRPKAWFDGFGSGFIPGLVALLWTVQAFLMPAAYAKPAPIDTNYLKRHPRDVVLVSIAGPAASLVLSILGGLVVRAGVSGDALLAATTFAFTNASLLVFHLLPVPGLDGGRLLALVLPPPAREVFRNADRYLALIVLVVLFVLTFLLGLAQLITGAICEATTGLDCLDLFRFV